MQPFTPSELAQMDRAAARRVQAAEFASAHPEYEPAHHRLSREVTADDCAAVDDILDAVLA
jgi:hypothetical protein